MGQAPLTYITTHIEFKKERDYLDFIKNLNFDKSDICNDIQTGDFYFYSDYYSIKYNINFNSGKNFLTSGILIPGRTIIIYKNLTNGLVDLITSSQLQRHQALMHMAEIELKIKGGLTSKKYIQTESETFIGAYYF